jgi:hypothetical protein
MKKAVEFAGRPARMVGSDQHHDQTVQIVSRVSERLHRHPTVLLALDDNEMRSALSNDLPRHDYVVLEAPDVPSMVEVVLTQTRPIDVLLIDEGMEKQKWAARLRSFRRAMTVLCISNHHEVGLPDVLNPKSAISTIRTFLAKSAEHPT